MAKKTANTSSGYQVTGASATALFTLKLHRGEGMVLVAMDWKDGEPPDDFVGFAIEYREPDGDRFFVVKNRLSFDEPSEDEANERPERFRSTESPFQKFRWVHFPRFAEKPGAFTYRVTPMFMNSEDQLNSGEPQEADIVLARETYPGAVNVAFTRGFVSSQAFVDKYDSEEHPMSSLLPEVAAEGLEFKPTHPKADEAYEWMGFESRRVILELLDEAIADKADVYLIAYDLNMTELVSRLKKVGKRLKVIIDDSKDHKEDGSAENEAEQILSGSAGEDNVLRQHMRNLQHNKMLIVDGPNVKKVVCGSTNFSWRGFYVQANNAVVLTGAKAVRMFKTAFDSYWNDNRDFDDSPSAELQPLALGGVDIQIAFSPHSEDNAMLQKIGDDIRSAKTSVFFSLAFLSQTGGPAAEAAKDSVKDKKLFVYGISDKRTKIDLLKPDGNEAPVSASSLSKNVPRPFKIEPDSLTAKKSGTRMHHKFVVLDFDTPKARVYTGSYNFSNPADRENGENLLLIRDRRIATSYMVEALRIFDHYHFRLAQSAARSARKSLLLKRPPRKRGEEPWWKEYYSVRNKIRDRELFS